MTEELKSIPIEAKESAGAFMEKVEKGLDEMMRSVSMIGFPKVPNHEPDDPKLLVSMILTEARNMAWAYQRFPVFDLSVLSLLRKQTFKLENFRTPQGTIEDKEVQLFVPMLYWTETWLRHSTIARWSFLPEDWQKSWEFSGMKIEYNGDAIAHNVRTLNGLMRDPAQCISPTIPLSSWNLLEKVRSRFEKVMLVFEASWSPELKHDPFIIGLIRKTAFMIDHFEVTNHEKYILAEHVTKAV